MSLQGLNSRSESLVKRHLAISSLLAPCALIFADGMAFVIAGVLGLFFAIAIVNAEWPIWGDLFEWGVRERLTDFLFGDLLWLIWFHVIKSRYRRPIPFWSEVMESSKVIVVLALANLALMALTRHDYSRSIWFFGWTVLIPLIPLLRTLTRSLLLRLHYWSRPTWIVGQGENAEEAKLALESEWQMGFQIQGLLSSTALNQEVLKELLDGASKASVIRDIRDIVFVIALEDHEANDLSALVLDLTLLGVRTIHIIPTLRGIPLYGADLSYFFSHEVLLLGLRNNLAMRFSKIIKMAFDMVVASILLVPASLILLVAAMLIWLEDRGPIFYVQTRLGFQKKEFQMLKLRSMRTDADAVLEEWKRTNSKEWQAYSKNNFKIPEDPRLLRVGKFLRRTSIDELPQLFNVLRGDMSLVGPRPILPREAEVYGKNLVLYQSARPGMTGLWQVSGRSKTSFQQRGALDAWYIRNWSLAYDIILLLRTISVVLGGRGAY